MKTQMKNKASKTMLALALGVGATSVVGTALPMQTQAADIPSVTLDSKGKITAGGSLAKEKGGMSGAWNKFIEKYRFWIAGFSGIAAVTMILFFIMNFMRLGASSGNPQARSQAVSGLIWTGIAAAGLGGVSIVVSFFYNALG